MNLFDAINLRGSCRSYKKDPLDRAIVDALIEAGARAPSALNQQPWRFVVVEDEAMRQKIAEHALATRDDLADKSGQGWVAKYDAGFIKNAPVHLVVTANPKKIGLGSFLGETAAHVKAASACIENILLAATANGLGSMWFTMYDKDHLAQLLTVPEGYEVVGLLPLGYPEGEIKSPPRKDVGEVTSYI